MQPKTAAAATTWNPADKGANITLSGGNLTFTKGGPAGSEYVRATQAKASGSFSVTIITNDTGSALFPGAGFSDGAGTNGGSLIADNALLWVRDGRVFVDGSSIGTVAPTFTVADVLTLRLNRALDRVYLSKNGGAETAIDITVIAGANLFPGAGAFLDGAATANFTAWV